MKCEECRARMPELWENTLDHQQRAEAEMHLASCLSCRSEADQFASLWQSLGEIGPEPPPRGMRTRFYEKLEAYKQGLGESESRARARGAWVTFQSWWAAHPALQFGLSAATLVLGFLAGLSFDQKRDNAQFAQLRSEVSNMKQMVTLSLLQQQGASDRLRGVNWAYQVQQPDTEVLAALLYTVNHDPNINVRLAAVDALQTFSNSQVARKGMVQAVAKQDSPMVQIALIDQIADLRDQSAAPALKLLTSDSKTNPEVRQRAQWALGRLQ